MDCEQVFKTYQEMVEHETSQNLKCETNPILGKFSRKTKMQLTGFSFAFGCDGVSLSLRRQNFVAKPSLEDDTAVAIEDLESSVLLWLSSNLRFFLFFPTKPSAPQRQGNWQTRMNARPWI